MTALAGRGLDRPRRAGALGAAGLLATLGAAGYAAGTGHAAAVIGVVVALGAAALVVQRPQRAALALLVVLPFCVYPAAAGGFSLFLALPVALGAAAGLAVLDHPRRPVPLPLVPYVALVGLAVASAAHSADVTTGASRVLYLIAFGLLAWTIGRAIAAELITPVAVAKALAAGGALAAVALLAQFTYGMVAGRDAVTMWLASVYPLFGGQHGGATQTPNWWIPSLNLTRAIFPFMAAPSAGGAMMLGLLASVWLRGARARGAAVGAWPAVAAVLTAAALLATFSRQAWIGALAGLLVLGARRRRGGVLAVLGVLAVVAFTVPVPGHGGTFAAYLATSTDTTTTSTATRIGLWQQALDLIGRRPLLGVGPGQYASLNPDPLTHPVYYAHDVILDVAVELGVAAAAAFAALFATGIVRAWRRGAELAAALLVAYLVAGLFDDVLYFPRNGFALAAAFGLIAAGRAP